MNWALWPHYCILGKAVSAHPPAYTLWLSVRQSEGPSFHQSVDQSEAETEKERTNNKHECVLICCPLVVILRACVGDHGWVFILTFTTTGRREAL